MVSSLLSLWSDRYCVWFQFFKVVEDCIMELDKIYFWSVLVNILWMLEKNGFSFRFYTCHLDSIATQKVLQQVYFCQPQTPGQNWFFPPNQRENEMPLPSSWSRECKFYIIRKPVRESADIEVLCLQLYSAALGLVRYE